MNFRITKDVLDNLKSFSKEEKVSLNTFVNQIFESYVSWDSHASEIGWVVMLKSALQAMIKTVDRQTIEKIAKDSAETGAKEIAISMRGKYGISEWISILNDRAKSSGFFIKAYKDGNKTRLVMHHDMGENWSVFFRTYYETIFYDLGAKIKTDHTENSIVIELEGIN